VLNKLHVIGNVMYQNGDPTFHDVTDEEALP
jgi:hypothetical protein